MKKLSWLLIFAVTFMISANAATAVKFVEPNRSGLTFNVSIDAENVVSEKAVIEGVTYSEINLDNSGVVLEKGAPELRTVSAFLAVPQGDVSVNIAGSDYVEIENVAIIPSKGNLTRNIDPETVPYEFGKEYEQEWYPAADKMVADAETFVLRDISGVRVQVTPFQYNHKENKLRVYTKLALNVATAGITRGIGVRVSGNVSEDFEKLYSDIFMNYESPFDVRGYEAPATKRNLLIVASEDYVDAIQPLASWKRQIGFDVNVVKYEDVANNADSLHSYFQDIYDAGDLGFVLLVGEYEDIPCLKGKYESANSDNAYMRLAGGDNVPDAFIGRFSVKNEQQVVDLVEKTINYEKNPVSGNWYTRGVGIGSNQGSPKDYERINAIEKVLENKLGFSFSNCYEYPGDDNKQIIHDAVNEGVSVINYCGHGSDYSWVTSGFGTSDAAKLRNGGMLPVIWDVACVNGALHKNECFAEAWLRGAGADGGCIGMAAASTNEAWVPPTVWQVEVNENQMGNKQHDISTVISMYGFLACMEEYGATDRSYGNQLVEQKIYFGDPTVALRFESPREVAAEAVVVDGEILVSVNGAERDGLTITAYDNNVERNVIAKTDRNGYATLPYNGQTKVMVYSNAIVPVEVEITK